MREPRNCRASLILAAAMATAVVGSGCTAGVRFYDADYHDYHRWDDREDRAYRRYLTERQEEYREFPRLNNDEQRNYWQWRHAHGDTDND
jgi:hypothetical protein